MDLKNHFCVLKKSKSFECIFRIQKRIEITSIFKECVDTLFLLLKNLCALNRKWCGHALLNARHGNFLTLNLHVNIANVNAEKMMLSVFYNALTTNSASSALSNAVINCRFSAIYAENNFTSWIDPHAFLF